MMAVRILMLSLAAVISGCASTNTRYVENSRIIEFQLPNGWLDDTAVWEKERKRARLPFRKSDGIVHLNRIRRVQGFALCRLRQFRYVEKEVGYKWSEKEIAFGVASIRSDIIKNYDGADYLSWNIDTPLFYEKPYKEKIVASGYKKLGLRNNGVSVRDYHYKARYGEDVVTMLVHVFSVPSVNARQAGRAKYYIVVECDMGGSAESKRTVLSEIHFIIKSINFSKS